MTSHHNRTDTLARPADSGRAAETSRTDSLYGYLRTVSASPPLEREEEQQHGNALHNARRAINEIFTELSETCRSCVLNGDSRFLAEGATLPLERLEAAYDRLLGYARDHGDAETKEAVQRMKIHKRRLDDARDMLVKSNLRFVPYVIRQLGLYGPRLMDLVQEGNVGLMLAVDRFDQARGHRFSTYAFWWIRQAITRAMTHDFHLVKFSAYTRERLRRIRNLARELESELGRRPTPAEIARKMDLPEHKVRDLIVAAQESRSLESRSDDPESAGFLSVLPDANAPCPLEETLKNERRSQVHEALGLLEPRERQIIRLRFGIGFDNSYTLREVGEMLKISRERVRQIEVEAMAKISTMQKRQVGGPTATRVSAGVS